MRLLIDGYNLMYAGGLLGRNLGPVVFRRARHRFLNDLADALGAEDARETTVVFDAVAAPPGVPPVTSHKGISVVYAVDDETADDRIAALIGKHSHPKALTVVSSDRSVRDAASRRRAKPQTSEEFWTAMDARKERKARQSVEEARPVPKGPAMSSGEREHWLEAFGGLDDLPEFRDALAPEKALITDADVARIAREVDLEFG